MNLAAIFQLLEHLNDLEIIGYGGHFVFQNQAKIFFRQNICRPGLFMVCLYILKLAQKKQVISARSRALCQLTVCFELQS